MPIELRKRKDPPPSASLPAKKTKAAPKAKSAATKSKAAVAKAAGEPNSSTTTAPTELKATEKAKGFAKAKPSAPAVGSTIDLSTFGGTIETNSGEPTTLASLVAASKSGVILFTYPKASTPGCTTQACLFRDSYEPLTATGFAIYGLSADSPKANTNFKEKQRLPYALLCDGKAELIGAIGLKKSPSGTQRGVFVVGKGGEVLAAEAGSPAGTVEIVKKLIGGGK